MALDLSKRQVTRRSNQQLAELWELSVHQLLDCYRSRQTSPSEVVGSCLDRIEALDSKVGAFRHVCFEEARACAEHLENNSHSVDSNKPLYGIPIAIKELFDVKNLPGCYGSEVLKNRVSKADAEVVRRLRDAGAVIVGVTRAHEFGWGITTQHRTLGITRNPWDLERVPGGSSGGSAAAVAAGMVPIALGSDTGGSIRIPAAFCGVSGIKPTYGRIPKRGGVSLAPTMDHPGPIAKELDDLQVMLTVMSGYDREDSSTISEPLRDLGRMNNAPNSIVIGRCPDLHLRPLAPDHEELFESTLASISSQVTQIEEVSILEAEQIRPTFASIQMAEAYYIHTEVLKTFPLEENHYGKDVLSRLRRASEVSLSEYLGAIDKRKEFRRKFDLMFNKIDVLVTPVTAGGPSLIDDPDIVEHHGAPLEFRDLCMDYTVPQDLIGLPTCAIPVGLDSNGLPVAIQVTAPSKREDLCFQVAREISKATNFEKQRPSLNI